MLSDSLTMDRFECALATVLRAVGDRYGYAWYRGARTYRQYAQVELVIGTHDDPRQVRATYRVPLDDIRKAITGEVEMALYKAFASLLNQQRELPVENRTYPTNYAVDLDPDECDDAARMEVVR